MVKTVKTTEVPIRNLGCPMGDLMRNVPLRSLAQKHGIPLKHFMNLTVIPLDIIDAILTPVTQFRKATEPLHPNVLDYCVRKLRMLEKVLQAAKESGLKELPPQAVSALRTNKFYLFCFDPYKPNPEQEGFLSELYTAKNKRLSELLINPEKIGRADTGAGLSSLMNNFHRNMPGAGYRTNYRLICRNIPPERLRLFQEIDSLISELKIDLAHYQNLGKGLEKDSPVIVQEDFNPIAYEISGERCEILLPILETLIGRYHYSLYPDLSA